jgi:nitrogen fixation/metabolism regulation signal transduction histidine kinase
MEVGKMKERGGHEMRNFLLLVSVLVVVLIAAVILYTTFDSINRINQDAEREKDNVEQSLADFYVESTNASMGMNRNPVIVDSMNPAMMESLVEGDIAPMLDFLTALLRPVYTAEYVAYIYQGEIMASSLDEGIDESELPTAMPEETDEIQYEILKEFNGEEGYFFSVYLPFSMPGIKGAFMNLLIDRTEQIEAIDNVYEEEKSSLITRQIIIGVVAIVVALLLTLLGVRYLARRYITGPIDRLAAVSHSIMDGTFEGDVDVVEDSDYVDIQRLLQSGKVLMDKMGEVEE